MKTLFLGLLSTVFVLSTLFSQASKAKAADPIQSDYSLRLKLKEGDKFKEKVKVKASVTEFTLTCDNDDFKREFPKGEMKLTASLDAEGESSMDVKSVNEDKVAMVEKALKDFTVTGKADIETKEKGEFTLTPKKISYKWGEDEDEDDLSEDRDMKKFMDMACSTIGITPRGELVLDEKNKMFDNLPDECRDIVKAMFDGFKSAMAFPEKRVSPGSEWSNSIDLKPFKAQLVEMAKKSGGDKAVGMFEKLFKFPEKITLKYKFEKVVARDGDSCAKILVTLDAGDFSIADLINNIVNLQSAVFLFRSSEMIEVEPEEDEEEDEEIPEEEENDENAPKEDKMDVVVARNAFQDELPDMSEFIPKVEIKVKEGSKFDNKTYLYYSLKNGIVSGYESALDVDATVNVSITIPFNGEKIDMELKVKGAINTECALEAAK